MERQNFSISGNNYDYILTRRNIRSMRLTVDNDLNILVSAPMNIAKRKIESFIHNNKAFIDKHISKRQEALRYHNIKDYKTGEYFLLFGEKTNIVAKKYFESKIFLEGNSLYILTDSNTFEERKKRFDVFIKKAARKLFNEMLEEKYPYFKEKIKIKPSITARKMKTKWGSANPSKNKITLNTSLLYAPKPLIEYVLIHELCHFYYLNHSKDFYNLLFNVMPDYKEKRKELRKTYGYLI